jgi:hypothetical protein
VQRRGQAADCSRSFAAHPPNEKAQRRGLSRPLERLVQPVLQLSKKVHNNSHYMLGTSQMVTYRLDRLGHKLALMFAMQLDDFSADHEGDVAQECEVVDFLEFTPVEIPFLDAAKLRQKGLFADQDELSRKWFVLV